MSDDRNPETNPNEEIDEEASVSIGFSPLGGIVISADNARLSPQEAFVLAGQLMAHGTMLIQQSYAQQAMAAKMAAQATGRPDGLILP